MAMWRCPHCGTPQAETARCWVCRRSSTACATCRHFRASVAAKMGYCGLDRQRQPLSGDEIRACWESSREVPEAPATRPPRTDHARTPVPRRDFVEVAQGVPDRASAVRPPRTGDRGLEPAGDAPPELVPAPAAVVPRWSLWEDAET